MARAEAPGNGGTLVRQPVPEIVTFEYGATKYSMRLWNEDPDLKKLRHKVDSEELCSLWRTGVDHYVRGDWKTATQVLGQFQSTFEDLNDEKDGPAAFLLKFMQSHPGGVAPADWDGSRE